MKAFPSRDGGGVYLYIYEYPTRLVRCCLGGMVMPSILLPWMHCLVFEENLIGRRGCTQFLHGRTRMTVDPRITTMPGRSRSGLHQPGRHWLHQARSAVRCSASRMKGELCILPRTACKTDFGTLCLLSCLWMTAPMSYFIFWCHHSRDSNGYYYM